MKRRVEVNKTYQPYLSDKSKILIFYGGAGSGKSHFVAQKLILRCVTEPNHKILVLRKVGSTLRDSVYSLLKQIIFEMNLQNEWKVYRGTMTFEHFNGSTIILKGLDEPEKIKSISGITSMWLEEATEFTYEDFTQLLLRIRGELPKGVNYVQYILSFNPISEYHWLKKEVVDRIKEIEGATYVHTTFKDNSYLGDDYVRQLNSLKDRNPLYYQIYCLGEWGIEDKSGKFAYAFNQDKHVKPTVEHDKNQYTFLSFDFNVNPICCSVIQNYENKLNVIQTIKLDNSNIHAMCDYIKVKYRNAMFIVTGDATGQNRSALVKDNINYYTVIKEKLQLTENQIQVPSANPPMEQNKVLVNTVLETMDVSIAEKECEALIFDLKYVEVTQDNKIKKWDRSDDKQRADALDRFRYFCNTFLRDILRI